MGVVAAAAAAPAFVTKPWTAASWSRRMPRWFRLPPGGSPITSSSINNNIMRHLPPSHRYPTHRPSATPSTTESTTPTTLSSTDWIHDVLRQWDLEIAYFDDHRGLKTLRDRSPGETLLAIPLQQAWTRHSVLERFPNAFGPPMVVERGRTSSNCTGPALTEEQVLIVGLLLLQHHAPEDPYIQSLPPIQASILFAMYTTNASGSVSSQALDLATCLPSTYQRLIQAYRQHVQQLYESLLEYYQDLVAAQESSGTTTASHPATSDAQIVLDLLRHSNSSIVVGSPKKKNNTPPPRDFAWAFGTIRSRSIGMAANELNPADTKEDAEDDGTLLRVLVPGFDLLNHQFGASVQRAVHNHSLVIRSNDTYQAGDQVFISYVPTADDDDDDKDQDQHTTQQGAKPRDNLNLLLTYGFCPGRYNPEQVLFFDLPNVLDACAMVRPQYFSPLVQRQLQQLFTKLGKDRELYSFQGDTKQPKSCLVQAIAVMAELEQQLVSQPDPRFGHDVLQALLQTRTQELERGQQRTKQMMETIPSLDDHDCLVDLLESVETLLSVEQGYLSFMAW